MGVGGVDWFFKIHGLVRFFVNDEKNEMVEFVRFLILEIFWTYLFK